MDRKHLDILVPTRDRPTRLTAMLGGLAAQELPAELDRVRLYLLDNGQTSVFADFDVARQLDVLQHRGIQTFYLRRPHSPGIFDIRRELYGAGDGGLVLWLDDDVSLAPGTVTGLHEGITRHGFALTASLVIDLDGLYGEAITYSHKVADELAQIADWVEQEQLAAVGDSWMEMFLPQGTNLMFVREVFDRAGGYEAVAPFFAGNVDGWSEDVGMCIALKAAGEAFVDISRITLHMTPRQRSFARLDVPPELSGLLDRQYGASSLRGVRSPRRGSGDEKALIERLREMARGFAG